MYYFLALTTVVAFSYLEPALSSPNFIFVLTDDQDLLLNGLMPMKNTIKLVANNGATFANTFVNSPICCPSRSTILTGKYAHNTGVRNNSISGNCSSRHWQNDHEPRSIAAILKSAGNYTTFYAGKYLNQYGSAKVGGTRHVPQGYDWWLGLKGNSKYFNYTLSMNGTARSFRNDYLTDAIKNYALDFLNQKTVTEKPFFMMLAPPAPHAPFTPAWRHKHRFPGAKAVRTPSFNYTSMDKHWLVEMPPQHLPDHVDNLDEIQRRRLQTLLAVDDMVGDIVSKLIRLEIFDDTYVIFSSDNGYHIGQFTQPWDKRQPYETDIRVPLIISGPKVPKKAVVNFPVSSVDIAPTIVDLAGIKMAGFDGTSFKTRLLNTELKEYDRYILIEYWGEGNANSVDQRCPWGKNDDLAECSVESWCKCQDSRNNTYACILRLTDTSREKFCRFIGGYFEAYDLVTDPFELRNIYPVMESGRATYNEQILERLTHCIMDECHV